MATMPEGFDPRLTPARPDLADAALKDRIPALRYVDADLRRIRVPVAPIRREPIGNAPLDTEALFGEQVRVLEDDAEGWSWVQLSADGYVGYTPTNGLASPGDPPTHRVAAPRTFLFPGADIKLPPYDALCFGSRVSVRALRGAFAATLDGFIHAGHLAPLDATESDFVAVAGRFLRVPYLWGGRSALGLDCSGLVQTALAACGIAAPRDSDMQEKSLGTAVEVGPDGPFQRGDLLFWPGHVAIAEDSDTLLHANAFHMQVAREPLFPALKRIAEAGYALRSVRRLNPVP